MNHVNAAKNADSTWLSRSVVIVDVHPNREIHVMASRNVVRLAKVPRCRYVRTAQSNLASGVRNKITAVSLCRLMLDS